MSSDLLGVDDDMLKSLDGTESTELREVSDKGMREHKSCDVWEACMDLTYKVAMEEKEDEDMKKWANIKNMIKYFVLKKASDKLTRLNRNND